MAFYTLQVSTDGIQKSTPDKEIIKVRLPKSAPYIATPDILYSDEKNVLLSYAYNKWQDIPNSMIQNIMVNTLAESGRYQAALLPGSRARANVSLESRIAHFTQLFDSPSHSMVRVSLHLHLIDERTRQLIASRHFDYTEETRTPDAKGAVDAFNAIMQTFSSDMLSWLSRL